jgi:hypothetical protein
MLNYMGILIGKSPVLPPPAANVRWSFGGPSNSEMVHRATIEQRHGPPDDHRTAQPTFGAGPIMEPTFGAGPMI